MYRTIIQWYARRSPIAQTAIRFIVAACVGVLLGLVCGVVPEPIRPLCHTLAKLATATIGR